MVLIFGTRHKRYPIGFFRATCHACGAVTDHLRVWDKGVVHMWFIPVLPIKSRRLVLCGGCGAARPDLPELDGVPIGGIVGLPAGAMAAPSSDPAPPQARPPQG